MPIVYGQNLSKSWGTSQRRRLSGVLMKAYTVYSEPSDVFLSYHRSDEAAALGLAEYLDAKNRNVFVDVHDHTLHAGHKDLDEALITAIQNADTMVIVVSDETQKSWWVPWEIGVCTPYRKPRALYKPRMNQRPPTYLQNLKRLYDAGSVNQWLTANTSRPIRR